MQRGLRFQRDLQAAPKEAELQGIQGTCLQSRGNTAPWYSRAPEAEDLGSHVCLPGSHIWIQTLSKSLALTQHPLRLCREVICGWRFLLSFLLWWGDLPGVTQKPTCDTKLYNHQAQAAGKAAGPSRACFQKQGGPQARPSLRVQACTLS